MSTYSQPSFSSSTWKRGGAWICKLDVISQEQLKIEVKLLLSANRKSYMPRRLDLEWSFHGSLAPSVWKGRVNVNALCTSPTLKSTSSASRAISAVAELFVILTRLIVYEYYFHYSYYYSLDVIAANFNINLLHMLRDTNV